jgi:hypothetical protein
LAAITAPAAAALAALDRGDLAGYDAAMAPTVPLSRLIFDVWSAPADQTVATVRERFAAVLGTGRLGHRAG